MSRICENTIYDSKQIAELKRTSKAATQVVGWYPHSPYESGHIRGPWHRWINVLEGTGVDGKHTATVEDDITYISTAMNHFPHLLQVIDKQNRELKKLKRELKDAGKDHG